jgi:hypothetical protein
MLVVGRLYRYVYYGQQSSFNDGELLLCVNVDCNKLHTFLTQRGLVNLKWAWVYWWLDEAHGYSTSET